MYTLNQDTTFCVINFLDNKSIYNLSIIDKNNSQLIKNNEKIIIRNILIKKWGYQIYKLIDSSDLNIKDLTTKNMENHCTILDLFYYNVIKKNLVIKTKLFVEIYDLVYNYVNRYPSFKDCLFKHRIISIKKYCSDINSIKDNDKKINNIINCTRYLNQYYINYRMDNDDERIFEVLSNEDVINLVNLYPTQRL